MLAKTKCEKWKRSLFFTSMAEY
ncbi:hypothetical protein CMEL01_14253 [Colletotrichum melonis]|uniref:Uncharacterized protein n=2 Tax=Colletotrichum acutatum species complex TaxID=2707335 RepID=A0AAJ0DTK5_9PEZI|nr:hypothetical protein CSPX01_08146 [Colletotrichum filicis]KAK1462286.1 hypothetical protein CMEL01_14253 [Colletotrichum melonis]KAK1510486.1 hypothetical protein CCOS01_15317 [Colletotrichum costaricense]